MYFFAIVKLLYLLLLFGFLNCATGNDDAKTEKQGDTKKPKNTKRSQADEDKDKNDKKVNNIELSSIFVDNNIKNELLSDKGMSDSFFAKLDKDMADIKLDVDTKFNSHDKNYIALNTVKADIKEYYQKYLNGAAQKSVIEPVERAKDISVFSDEIMKSLNELVDKKIIYGWRLGRVHVLLAFKPLSDEENAEFHGTNQWYFGKK